MICVTGDGIHYNEKQLIGGPADSNVPLRLLDEAVVVRKTKEGNTEISVTLTTDDDVLLG